MKINHWLSINIINNIWLILIDIRPISNSQYSHAKCLNSIDYHWFFFISINGRSKQIFFFFAVFSKIIENMFFVFLSSYRNTCESLRELKKNRGNTHLSCSPKLLLMFLQLDRNTVHALYFLIKININQWISIITQLSASGFHWFLMSVN